MATVHREWFVKGGKEMTDSEKLDLILEKLDSMDQRMSSIETRMDALEKKMDALEKKMDALEKRMDALEKRMDALENEVSTQKNEIETLKQSNTDIKLTIENELNRNIQLVAEGHLDLNRKLEEVMRPVNALEMLQVQVNMLQSKIRDIEGRLEARG